MPDSPFFFFFSIIQFNLLDPQRKLIIGSLHVGMLTKPWDD